MKAQNKFIYRDSASVQKQIDNFKSLYDNYYSKSFLVRMFSTKPEIVSIMENNGYNSKNIDSNMVALYYNNCCKEGEFFANEHGQVLVIRDEII